MRAFIIILYFIFLSIIAYGQNDSIPFFNEFSISINRTDLRDNNTNDGYGFGLGAYIDFWAKKKINILVGFEYNRSSQLKKYLYEGHFANSTDVTYYINSLSIPLITRVNFGNTIKIFAEAGVFVDLNVGARRKGMMHTFFPDENNRIENKDYEFSEMAILSILNYGISYGIGLKIPIKKCELIIKPEYKWSRKVLSKYYNTEILNKYMRLMIGLKI
jgi:hypothetical protein